MDKEQEATKNRLSPQLLAGIILVLFFGIALYLRVYLPYHQVFSGEWIRFTSVDAYYHLRLVDNLVHNFPQLINFDPYFIYPTGVYIDNIHFFDWLLAGIIWVIGLGAPTQHTIDVVASYFPAILATLTVIPVYFIGKELFGRLAGVISAGLIAILPGEFLGRSILGFTDHHIAETLFSATAMMFLILAIKASRERGLSFDRLWQRDWAMLRKPAVLSLCAGLSLGIYLVTWAGGLLFVFIIAVYFVVQFIIDYLRHQSTDYLGPVCGITFLAGLIIYVIFSRSALPLVSLVIASLIPVVLKAMLVLLNTASRKIAAKESRPAHYPLALLGLGAVGLVIFYAASPSFFREVLNNFSIFTWSGSRTILEMQPFLAPQGEFTVRIAWGNFTTSFFLLPACPQLPTWLHWIPGLSLISLGILLYSVIKHGNAEKSLFLVWSLIILAATLGQRRFAYYFAVNVALLSGYLLWLSVKLNNENHPNARYLNTVFSIAMIIFLVFFSNLHPLLVAFSVALLIVYLLWQLWRIIGPWLSETSKTTAREKTKPKKIQRAGFHLTTRHVNVALAVIITFFLAFFPNIDPAVTTAARAHFAPDTAWLESLSWLKENTPEPFGTPDSYYQLYEPPPPDEQYEYPDSAYAVMAWVDYGYWITRVAHRPVNLTPGPGGVYVAKLFLSQDEDSSQEIKWHTKRGKEWVEEMIPEKEIAQKLGSAYIIMDHQMVTSKYWALVSWAEKEMTDFFDTYFLPQEQGTLKPITLFHPEYYRSLVVRLYNFDGQAVTPALSVVISYEEKPVEQGGSIKLITDVQSFPSYEEATDYVSSQESGNYRIVGDNPFISPVPLEELKHYKLIHGSEVMIELLEGGYLPAVKIFEYIK